MTIHDRNDHTGNDSPKNSRYSRNDKRAGSPRPGKKALEDHPRPEIVAPSDAIIRIVKTTICGTDLHILKSDPAARTDKSSPSYGMPIPNATSRHRYAQFYGDVNPSLDTPRMAAGLFGGDITEEANCHEHVNKYAE